MIPVSIIIAANIVANDLKLPISTIFPIDVNSEIYKAPLSYVSVAALFLLPSVSHYATSLQTFSHYQLSRDGR